MALCEDIRTVAPALEKYTQDRHLGEVWKWPSLVPRDHSIVTVAALIARNQTIEMPCYLNVALDNAVNVGWPNVFSALPVAKDVFEKRPK